jgi:indolepyruvate ferredoxin oxidoreductase, alpha subunit
VRRLLTGSEATARGALEAGLVLAAACPGPVASEVLDALAAGGVACERAPSEKVALELALGASLAGARSLAALRAGGIDAAAGALVAASCAGAAGLAVVLCDDPGGRLAPAIDSRPTARAARVPVIEPSDPAECHAFVAHALALSEDFETPVAVRLTTRLADSAGPVEVVGPRRLDAPRGWRWEPPASRSFPGRGAAPRARAQERLALLAAHGCESPLNRMEMRSAEMGVVTSGLAYGMVREALPQASVLKLGLVFPVPTGLVREFAARVRRVCVVEEMDPFLEQELRADGIACEGKDRLAPSGELSPGALARAFAPHARRPPPPERVPERPPELCPGCPHRATFQALKRLHVAVTGDLGCAALASLPPLSAVDRAPGAGASVAVARGLEVALGERIRGRSVAVLGDGALLHSGMGALALPARSASTVVVADNGAPLGGIGGEGGAGVGVHATGGRRVDLGSLCLALGVEALRLVDPLDLAATVETLREELARAATSVVIARSPCVRLRIGSRPPRRVDARRCNRCGACLRLGCPALSEEEDSMAIDRLSCAGCGLCAQVCRAGAIAAEARA